MARRPRHSFPGAIFHVLNRFVDKHPFFQTESDYRAFLAAFTEIIKADKVRVFAYCLMPNHFHFLMDSPDGDISRFLQRLLTRAARNMNLRAERVGHLFQGRSKTLLVENEGYFETAAAYVLLNPVRARLAESPFAYEWCSANEMFRAETFLDRRGLAERISGRAIAADNTELQKAILLSWLGGVTAEENSRRFREEHRGQFLSSAAFRKERLRLDERRNVVAGDRKRRHEDKPPALSSWSEVQARTEAVIAGRGEDGIAAWKNQEAARYELSVWIAHILGHWTYDRIQAEHGDARSISHYSMIISRIRQDAAKAALVSGLHSYTE